jgi:ATP-binding protein involved in chromosome partitioning
MQTNEHVEENTCQDPGTHSAPEVRPKGLPPRVEMDVKNVILVLSGKGGVGKSTVAVNLAMALSAQGYPTGLLDLDIHGPNIAKMLGIEDKKLECLSDRIEPVKFGENLSVISMAFVLPDVSAPVIWRGPLKMSAVRQFLGDVNWGSLEYLVVDLPPGTGDEALSIIQLAPHITGAVIVTTPQDVATLDAQKAIRFVQQTGTPILGIIENMSGMVCPHCSGDIDLFGTGGGKKIAETFGVPFLGSIPLDPEVRKAGDEGHPMIMERADTPTVQRIRHVMEELIRVVDSQDSQ